MCFKKSDKPRLIGMRAYAYKSGRYYFFLGINKEYDRKLVIDFKNDGGVVDFVLSNETTKESETLNNPKTGIYEFTIVKGEKYKLTLHSQKAVGAYKISIQKIIE